MFRFLASLALLAALSAPARAGTVSVVQTVTGTPGDWTASFTVTNDLPANVFINFFGVRAPERDISGSPSGYNPNFTASFTHPSEIFGQSISFNNLWWDDSASNLGPGTTLGGFDVHITTEEAPEPLYYLAWGRSATEADTVDTGCDTYCGTNPLFIGIASVASQAQTETVPEPASLALLAPALLALGLRRRR